MNRTRAKMLKKKTVNFSNFDLNYERFDKQAENVTLPVNDNINKPPQPSPKAGEPKPQVGVNPPKEEKKKDAGGCCTVF